MIYYLIIINIISFIIFGFDKRQAINKKRRISENKLIMFSLLGGVFGSYLGMKIFHHKTKKIKFKIIIPLIMIIWIIITKLGS